MCCTYICNLFLSFINATFIYFSFFFFNDTATTEIYTLSLHDALPISKATKQAPSNTKVIHLRSSASIWPERKRSEEHTSELQSRSDLVCRLLLEKKKKNGHPTP